VEGFSNIKLFWKISNKFFGIWINYVFKDKIAVALVF
jgi:hypothetical protein